MSDIKDNQDDADPDIWDVLLEDKEQDNATIAQLTKANAELREALELLLPVAQEFERQSSHGPGGGRGYVVFTKARKALANSSEGE